MSRLLILFLFLSISNSGVALAGSEVLRLHGSNTIGAKLAPVLAQKWLKSKGFERVSVYETGHEESLVEGRKADGTRLAVEIRAHGSSTAFVDLANGTADIGMASRPIKGNEVDELAALGKMDNVRSEVVIGLDGVAVIVNQASPLVVLDKSVLRKIFSGEIRDWAQVGGKPGAIRVLARDDNSGTYDTFKHLVLEGGAGLVGTAGRYESSTELVSEVAADPLAIGFVGLAYTQGVKALAISDGGAAIAPEPFTVATEDYALARRLFLYVPTRGDKWLLAQEFAHFAASHQGQQALGEAGFISQEIKARPITLGSSAPAEYARLADGALRLSLNFRFDKGSAHLDNKAKRDVTRLKQFLAKPENAQRKLLLFGFADNDESLPIRSLLLSIERVDAVAELLLNEGLRPFRVRGYGNSVAVAANDSESGRFRNRRVEVWVQ